MEQKLAIEFLLHNPSSFQSQREIKNSYPAGSNPGPLRAGQDSVFASQRQTAMNFAYIHPCINIWLDGVMEAC